MPFRLSRKAAFRRQACLAAVCLASAAAPAAAQSVPGALHNKSVVLSWNEYRVQRGDDGHMSRSNTGSRFVVYVSSAGRMFSSFARQNPKSGRSNKSDLAPDGNVSVSGVGQGQRSMRFEGNQMVSENAMRSGARRVEATFNASFTSCTLRVLYGKEGGANQYHRAMNGKMYTIISTDVTGATCSIRPGNLVGGS
jgi:hypothetical protein